MYVKNGNRELGRHVGVINRQAGTTCPGAGAPVYLRLISSPLVQEIVDVPFVNHSLIANIPALEVGENTILVGRFQHYHDDIIAAEQCIPTSLRARRPPPVDHQFFARSFLRPWLSKVASASSCFSLRFSSSRCLSLLEAGPVRYRESPRRKCS